MYPCFVRAGHFERDLEVDWQLLLEECREFVQVVDSADSVDFVSVGGSSVVVFAAETVATAGSAVATVVIVAVV